jgi:NAD(P)-dependent dehydrogenase (short-subunit alcohol dehydrogenase family)
MSASTTTMQGKVCLVTGATSGIGLVAARELARRGAWVVLVGRNPARIDAALAHIRAQVADPELESLFADLSSQQEVRGLAQQFQDRHSRLDVLVNNAGGLWLDRELTVDGLERTFAVNHLAYFLLTNLLLNTLKASAPSRIVNVSSDAHRRAVIDFDNLQGERRYRGWQQYCRTKLMNLLFTYELAGRHGTTSVSVNALHPGWVATGFGGGNGVRGRLLQLVAGWFAITPDEGARTIVYLASSPDVAGTTGRYFVREQPVASSAASYDEAAARRLWEVSEQLCQVPSPSC